MLCAYTRSRYQVSVYRTIGPLVLVLSHCLDVAHLMFSVSIQVTGVIMRVLLWLVAPTLIGQSDNSLWA